MLRIAFRRERPYLCYMSVQELEAVVSRLSAPEIKAFDEWFEEFKADLWDKQIEEDVAAGKLDRLAKQADEDFEAGRCAPL